MLGWWMAAWVFAAPTASVPAQTTNMAGQKEQAMTNCPATQKGALTTLRNLPDGVELTIVSTDPNATEAVRRLARRQAIPRTGGQRRHTGTGTGVGDVGFCPIIHVGTRVSVDDVPGGVKVTVHPTDPVEAEALQRLTKERVDAIQSDARAPRGGPEHHP
jgi:hypothetical protein